MDVLPVMLLMAAPPDAASGVLRSALTAVCRATAVCSAVAEPAAIYSAAAFSAAASSVVSFASSADTYPPPQP